MNKKQRAVLASLAPAVEFAGQRERQSGRAPLPYASIPGFALRPRAEAGAPAELMIYGRIGGGGFLSDGISASDVAAALRDAGPGPLTVRINSGGGDVFDGVAIYSLLVSHPGTITAQVDGLAASAASFIMLAADHIRAERPAMFMIHGGMTMTFGNQQTHERAAALLGKVSDTIAGMYADRAGEDIEAWRTTMDENGEDGTWYTGQEAYDAGLIDEIIEHDDEGGEQPTFAALAGWANMLPVDVAERVKNSIVDPLDGEHEKEAAVQLDVTALAAIMKEVFA